MELTEFKDLTGLKREQICACFAELIKKPKVVNAAFVDYGRNLGLLLTLDFPILGPSRTGVPQIGSYKVFKEPSCKRCNEKDVWITADNTDYWAQPGLISLSHASTLVYHIKELVAKGQDVDGLVKGKRQR